MVKPEVEILCRCPWCRSTPVPAPLADGEDMLCSLCRTKHHPEDMERYLKYRAEQAEIIAAREPLSEMGEQAPPL